MRGAPDGTFTNRVYVRFIPAYAGNTLFSINRVDLSSVHPRVCGEHSTNPASYYFFPVHPRVCGEHVSIHIIVSFSTGSSPRMRGTLSIISSNERIQRFIPAYAGNTSDRLIKISINAVHPRVCGEHTHYVL